MSARTIVAVLFIGALLALFSFSSSATYSLLGGKALVSQFDESGISAQSVLIEDRNTGEVLYERDADEVRPIASVSKLFTAHVANESDHIDDDAQIVWQDFATEGTAGKLWLGEHYTIRELLFPLLLSSSNDAGAAIERTLGKQYFNTSLDSLYRSAGLQHTSLQDPTGLAAGNQSTARELAQFLGYLKENDPYVLDITTLRSYVGEYRGWINNNPGRQYDEFRGGKHGYTPEAGRTFAGIFDESGNEYVVILLGSSDLKSDLDRTLSLLK